MVLVCVEGRQVRRSPVAVWVEPDAVETAADRSRLSALVQALCQPPQLDVTLYVLELAKRLGPWVHMEPAPGALRRAMPREAQVQTVKVWGLEPRLLVASLGLHWLSGPAASRPAVLVGVGYRPAGRLVAGLGRVLGVGSAALIRPRDLPQLEGRKERGRLRALSMVAAEDPATAHALSCRGLDPVFAASHGPEAAWSAVGAQMAEAFVRGRSDFAG